MGPGSGIENRIAAIRALNSVSEISDQANALSKKLGFTGFYYASFVPGRGPVWFDHRPKEWVDRFFAMNYGIEDPIVWHGLRTSRPFTWEQAILHQKPTQQQRKILNEAWDFGLRDGFTVPCHGKGYKRAAAGFFSDSSQYLSAALRSGKTEAEQLALAVHERVDELTGKEPDIPKLAPREIECLYWAANGKSSSETADILSISVNTVNSYMRSAKAKLGVYTTNHAVAKAITLGLVIAY